MAHAWLDSLSEDWVSQPGSDSSASQLPRPKLTKKDEPIPSPRPPSRIPRWRHPGVPAHDSPKEKTSSVLNEYSANDINISGKRLSSKFYDKNGSKPISLSRSVSRSTNGSVVHNTINQTAPLSPGNVEAPEWKRRLVYGEIEYGEQRDLFCSAAVGLQDMFKPPQNANEGQEHGEAGNAYDMTMPSSPPLHGFSSAPLGIEEELNLDVDEDADYSDQVTPSPSPRRPQREIKYKSNIDDSLNSSIISNGSLHQPAITMHPADDTIYRDTSCLTLPPTAKSEIRKTSGHGDSTNEDFSPILIGKHNGEDGKLGFAPLEIPADQLRHRLERLRLNQILIEPQNYVNDEVDNAAEGESPRAETTDEYIRNGGYINLRRGGRSADDSFRHRPLSPDLGVDSSGMLPEESLQASTPKHFPTVRTEQDKTAYNEQNLQSPMLPLAPFPSPEKRQTRHATGAQSAGSPLKLFGPYDTFTNQTLLRRISQFEHGLSQRTSRQSSAVIYHNESTRRATPVLPQFSKLRTTSQFGVGESEGYVFTSEVSHLSADNSELSGKENMSPMPHLISSGALRLTPANTSLKLSHGKRVNRRHFSGTRSHDPDQSISPPAAAPLRASTPKRDSGSDGKRPRTSPSKDPTPKRRRTLHRSDIAFGNDDHFRTVDGAHENIQQLLGHDFTHASAGRTDITAPDILTETLISRLHSPIPGQVPWQHAEQIVTGIKQSTFNQIERSPSKPLQRYPEFDDPKANERKPSMRTQDFVDQAAQIMAMIRNQVVQPGLRSVEESEAEHGSAFNNGVVDESDGSTAEPFSRPPSREGKPVSRFPLRQEDPELINHLKKYQELSDMGDVISSSVRSMGLAKDAIRAAQEVERMINESGRVQLDRPLGADGDIVSDLPNIRISTNPQWGDKSTTPSRDFPSNSSGRSSSHTYPTNSSRGSESRKIIMPESVSHLIPDRIGGMYLDKQKNIWIRRKDSGIDSGSNMAPSDSEDDPFASIPDLTVDMTKEMKHLKLNPEVHELGEEAGDHEFPLNASARPQSQISVSYTTLSVDEQLDLDVATFAREQIEKLGSQTSGLSDSNADSHLDAQGSVDKPSIPRSTTRRHLTISFSSPIASIIQDMLPEDLDSLEDDPDLYESPRSADTNPLESPLRTQSASQNLNTGRPSSSRSNRSTQAHGSIRGSSFIPRPVSRIDEQDEDSTVEIPPQDDRQLSLIGDNTLVGHKSLEGHTSFSLMINQTPGHNAMAMRADDSLLIGRNIGRLSLSPLSEFTINNPDQSYGLEVSYVMGQRHMATGDGSKRVLSMTIRQLVDKLSQAEPCEPYWEDMAELDLHDKQLTSLHMLDEFCSKLITLDISHNALGHLDGVPTSVRQLKASSNMLTELTSWDHLIHLQYVDISGNEVHSLSALKYLVHLRSLKADDNQLTSLDGLDCHDGLLTLRARNNHITDLNFTGIKLERLTDLDLGSNKISSIRNLDLLPSLSRLNLAHNQLQSLSLSNGSKALRHLDLADNKITILDIRHLANLQTLYADRNCLHEVSGFRHARRLDSLSLREQHGDIALDLGFLTSACEIRKLFLSGNYMTSFQPMTDFLNLQFLELANCGLTALPKELGQLMPNLRTLNINFNAISDLSPLRFIPRLKKLLVAGNRLVDSTLVTELLTEFPHLVQLDLRDNPITQGFYPSMQMLVTTKRAGRLDSFALPDAEVDKDNTFASRLDETTRLRRRLHEVVFVASCKRLRRFDGLSVSRRHVMARDFLLQKLVDEGLVPELDETLIIESEPNLQPKEDIAVPISTKSDTSQASVGLNNSRWSAEDSFA